MILSSSHKSIPFALASSDKDAIEDLLQKVGADVPHQREDFAKRFTDSQHPAWYRYANGIYNHPKTWWIGIIQTQMVLGVWGARHKAEASIRQAGLAQVLYQLTAPENRDRSKTLVLEAARFNLSYRKADTLGRFHGGMFTNYASTGGRGGAAVTSHSLKWASRITNLTIASFGAAIGAIAANQKTEEDILNAIITGRPDPLPARYKTLAQQAPVESTGEIEHLITGEVNGVDALNRVLPGPVPIREFCNRPENVNLRDICK